MARASEFVSITWRSVGPCLSSDSIRARYCSTRPRAVYAPLCRPARSSAIVFSSSANAGTPGGADAIRSDEVSCAKLARGGIIVAAAAEMPAPTKPRRVTLLLGTIGSRVIVWLRW